VASPRAGKGLFQFEHTPPSDAAYQQQNLNLRSVKDNERRYALEQLQQCDNLREGMHRHRRERVARCV
jgi:hypothetical protein